MTTKPDDRYAREEAAADELYCSIGAFVVSFEHLMSALKRALWKLAGPGPSTMILLDAYKAEQSVKLLATLKKEQETRRPFEAADSALFKMLYDDLHELKKERNKVAHTHWFVGASPLGPIGADTDGLQIGSTIKKLKTSVPHLKHLTARCKSLASIVQSLQWPLEPPDTWLSNMYERGKDGVWQRQIPLSMRSKF